MIMPLIILSIAVAVYGLIGAFVAGIYKRKGAWDVDAMTYGMLWPGLPFVWVYKLVAGVK